MGLLGRAALVVLLATATAVAQQDRDFSGVEVKAQPVAGNVHMLTGAGGNIGVSAGPDGILIVDDQFAPLAEKIRAALKGINPGKLRFVLNTHWHGDHTGGNPVFGPEATIIAHENVRKRVSTGQQDPDGTTVDPLPKEGWPVVTFDSSLSVHFNSEEIKVIHYPAGHTDGDAVIFFTSSNVIHMGDLMFNGRFPYVDLTHGGDVIGYTKNVEAVIKQAPADVKIIPGHGSLATLADLKAFHRMLIETTKIVGDQMASGKSADEIRKAGLPAEWQSWGGGFISTDEWIQTIILSLRAKKSS